MDRLALLAGAAFLYLVPLILAPLSGSALALQVSEAEPVSVRAAEFGNYARLAFRSPAGLSFDISYTQTQVSVAFEGALDIDLSAVSSRDYASIGIPVVNQVSGIIWLSTYSRMAVMLCARVILRSIFRASRSRLPFRQVFSVRA